MAFTTVELTGTVLLGHTTPAAGASVTLKLNAPITDGSTVIAPEQITTYCADDGTFSVNINANDDDTTTPTGSYYQVVVGAGSRTLSNFEVVVPSAGAPTVDLFSLAQLSNPNPQAAFVSQLVAGDGVSLTPDMGTGQVTITSTGSFAPTGDLGGTSGNTIVETVAGGKTPVNTSSFLGFSQVIRPSADATGATDIANINAALAGGTNTSIYLNGSYVVNGPIIIPSGMTLVLADAYVKLANGSNSPIIANLNYQSASNPNVNNVHVRGIGRALLDYNGANQSINSPDDTNSCIEFVGVSAFSIEGIQFTNGKTIQVMLQACSNGRVLDTHVDVTTDHGYLWASFGCSNIVIDGFTSGGTWPDTVFSILTGDSATGFQTNMSPYAKTLTGTQLSVSGISFRNVTVSSSVDMFNIYWDGTSGVSISNVNITNIHNTYTAGLTGHEIGIGPAGYDSASLTAHNSFTGLKVEGYSFGAPGHTFLTLDADATDLQFFNIVANGEVEGLLGNLATPGSSYQAGFLPQIARIKFSGVHIPTLNTNGMCKLVAGYNATDISFEDVTIGTALGPLLANASDITGLTLSKVHVGTLKANPFQSTGNEVGVVKDFTYNAKGSALTAILPSRVPWRIEQPFPALAPADKAPAPVQGSEINCVPGMDPTGGAATTGGKYVADGGKWNLVTSFNTTFRPGQMFYPLLFHYDAGNIGLANGAAVAKWPDSALNSPLLQATSGNQPTYVASDSVLNNLPSVAFASASSQFIQTSSLVPIAQAKPFTVFMVYYWVALTGSNTVALGLTSASGFPEYEGTTSHTLINFGAATVNSSTTPATSTAYLATIAGGSGNTCYVGENKAAFASLTSGSAGSNSMSGVCVGSTAGGANYSSIHVAELFAYAGLVSSGDYAVIVAGLAAKYGITTS